MARLAPFRAIRYNLERIGSLDEVITQPYDKITPEMQAQYYERSPYNYVRLILARESDPYSSAQETLNRWWREGILIKEEEPGIYPYHQRFGWAGREFTRKGFVALCELEEFSSRGILPHERTHKGPKEDRLRLMRALRLDSEQIFLLYPDPEGAVDQVLRPYYETKPWLECTDEYGVVHLLWRVTDPGTIRHLQELFLEKVLLIADGHHRYETSLAYRDEECRADPAACQGKGFNYRTLTLVSLSDPGLLILPTHRALEGITHFDPAKLLELSREDFEVEATTPSKLPAEVAPHRIGFYYGGDVAWVLSLKDEARLDLRIPERSPAYRKLDVVILHTLLIEKGLGIGADLAEAYIRYERDAQEAIEKVQAGRYQACFLLSPTRPEEVEEVARSGERMPQKSTDFYPKLASGLLAFDLSDVIEA